MSSRSHTSVVFSSPCITVLLLASTLVAAEKQPIKVFILAGQSNMEGHAKVETFDYIGDAPETAPILEEMRGADGNPRVADNAWICETSAEGYQTGLSWLR